MMKQFSPHIYPEWGELIFDLPIDKQAEIFNAILKYPNVDLDSGIWRFIKSQIDKDYQRFQDRCNKNKEISNNYWKNKNIQTDTERLPDDTERLSNDILNINRNINKNDNINDNLNNIEINKENLNFETLFFEFWNLYIPVKCSGKYVDKGSKKLSLERFVKILKSGVNYEDIIAGTRAYLERCKQNRQLTLAVPTFLNQQRWADDYNNETVDCEDTAGKRQEPKSVIETYAEIANDYKQKTDLH